MKCPECEANVPSDAEQCATCGAALPSTGSSPVDRIADDAAQAVHDVVRVVQTVQKIGDEFAEASRSVAARTKSMKAGPGKVWGAAKTLLATEERKSRSAVRRVQAKGKTTARHLEAKGTSTARHVQAKGRSIERDVARAGVRAKTKLKATAGRALPKGGTSRRTSSK
jgi:hypothetical protein